MNAPRPSSAPPLRSSAEQRRGGPDKLNDLRLYRRPISTWWWVRRRSYFMFVMRELSSLFVAWWVLYLLLLLIAIGRGSAAYDGFLDWADTPWVVVVNVVALGFLMLHTVTWFNLTPQAMVVRLRGQQVPGWAIVAQQWAGLVVVSAFVLWLVSR